MASMPWIKLYTEMLDDPKMGKLDAATKWHFVELCLMAGECDAEGYLVNGDENLDIEEVAWRLRANPAEMGAAFEVLSDVGLVTQDPDGAWFVVNFSKRQGRPQYEKRRLWRERKQKQRERESAEDELPESPEPIEAPPIEQEADGSPDTVTRDSRVSPTLRERGEKEKEKEKEKRERPKPSPLKPQGRASPGVPEAVKTFRSVVRRYPSKAWYEDIASTVGEDDTDLQFWRDVIKAWSGLGWNETNVVGMLDFYRRREIPPGKGGARASPKVEQGETVQVSGL